MKTSSEGIDLIKSFESCRLVSYADIVGILTVGYGHTGADVKESMIITKDEAEDILRKDLGRFEKSVLRQIKVPLSQPQFDALVSFAFNLGSGALQRSTLRQKLNRGEYDEAAAEFLKWCRAGGKKVSGLLRRREAEMKLFQTREVAESTPPKLSKFMSLFQS